VEWDAVGKASPSWVGVALVASALTYVGAAISMAGSVTDRLPLTSTFAAQLASSFTNRITPAKVGGLALNVRYLTKQGVSVPAATTGVGVSTAAGSIVHVALTVVAVLWAGKAGLGGLHAPSAGAVGLVVAVLAGGGIVVVAVPPLRHWFLSSVIPSIRRAVRSFVEVMRTPRNVVMLLGGSALVTIANLAAFDASLRAFDVAVPLSTVAVVYLAGAALASAAPTPGGLGATEAALVAGLSVVSVAEKLAVPAVLLFRLTTFWIPILPGWIAFAMLQRRDDL
jgi:undecaprenyl-diphosphatase